MFISGLWMKVVIATNTDMPVIIWNTNPTVEMIRIVSAAGNRMVKERATLEGTLSGSRISSFPLLIRRQ